MAELISTAIEFGSNSGTVANEYVEKQLPNEWTKFEPNLFWNNLKNFVNVEGTKPAKDQTSKADEAINRARMMMMARTSNKQTAVSTNGSFFILSIILHTLNCFVTFRLEFIC